MSSAHRPDFNANNMGKGMATTPTQDTDITHRVVSYSSSRISCPRWQSQVTDAQSRKAGEEENTKGSCKEADALQPPVRVHRLYIPCSELNETSQIRKCHNTPRWQAENVRQSCSVYSLVYYRACCSGCSSNSSLSDEQQNHKHSSHRNYRVDKHASSSFAPI